MNTFSRNEGYTRFRKQLTALKHADFGTVRKLAQEAKQKLQEKRTRNLALPFIY